MKTYKVVSMSLIFSFVLLSQRITAEPIVVSDGPGSSAPMPTSVDGQHTIQITDGPMEWTAASRAGKKLSGAWVVETNGPGTGRLVTAKEKSEKTMIVVSDGPSGQPSEAKNAIVISDGPGHAKSLPNPETSTLAPIVATVQPVTMPPNIKHAVVEHPIVLGDWNRDESKDLFYVYSDKKSYGQEEHFFPTGWLGDYGDVRFEDASSERPHSGDTCIQITYLARSSQDNGWAGMYWQNPANNWGDKSGGFNLTGKKKVTFWARGAKGGEVISEFRVGGIGGAKGDSDTAATDKIILTKAWKQYTIPIASRNLWHIIGGFSWSANREANPHGMTFYLDDIRYE